MDMVFSKAVLALSRLSTTRTVGDLITTFSNAKVKGVREEDDACPVSNYIRQQAPGLEHLSVQAHMVVFATTVEALEKALTISALSLQDEEIPPPDEDYLALPISATLREFVRQFDAGAIPELDAQMETETETEAW